MRSITFYFLYTYNLIFYKQNKFSAWFLLYYLIAFVFVFINVIASSFKCCDHNHFKKKLNFLSYLFITVCFHPYETY